MSTEIRLFVSPLTGSVYASSEFKEVSKGRVEIVGEKFDVTREFERIAELRGFAPPSTPDIKCYECGEPADGWTEPVAVRGVEGMLALQRQRLAAYRDRQAARRSARIRGEG